MAKITDKASWQILEDVNKLINNATLIYGNELPENFDTLKTRYKEALTKQETIAKSIETQKQTNVSLYLARNRRDGTLAELDELFNPSKSNAASKRPVSPPPIWAKWDIMDGHQPREPRTLPVIQRDIKRHEETLRQDSKKIETLQIEHKTIEDDFKVSIDNLKGELIKLVGSNSAPDLRRIFEPVAEKQKIETRKKALEQALEKERQRHELPPSIWAKWDIADGHTRGGGYGLKIKFKKRRQTKRRQPKRRQTKRRQTKRRQTKRR